MKIVRVIGLLLVSLLAISPLGTILAQEEPSYSLALTPMGERYDAIAVVARDKFLPMELANEGTAAISNITFSSEEPVGWVIEFLPDKVDSLGAKDSAIIEVIIRIPGGTDPGDYMIALMASGEQASSKKVDIRIIVNAPEPEIEISPVYPSLEAIAGEAFVFEVEFRYSAAGLTSDPIDFNLRSTAPQGWEVYLTPPYEKEKKISAIRLKPAFSLGNKTRFVAVAPVWPIPEPGEYKVTLEAISEDGKLRTSTEFTARITANYFLALASATERYNTEAEAGKDSYFSVKVGNLGTAAVDDIQFSSTNPEGWKIEFSPEKIDSLEAISTQTIDVNIKPSTETIAGDYSITLRASGKQATSDEILIRVTVESPTIWGWVGIGIILVVIAGLVVIFMRFSRR